jgi:methylglutaconyl-CoA hydratase
MAYQYLSVRREGSVEYVTLNRPDVRNAFNERVIADLSEWAEAAAGDAALRVVVLAGAGKVNLEDAARAAAMFGAVNALPCAVIGRVHGAALGGGAGLAAVCDIVVSSDSAVFGFTETKLGILPAMISPFVLPKIGMSAARELFLTGMRFDAARAREIGLVHAVVPEARLDQAVQRYVDEILSAAPTAVAAAKGLLPQVSGRRPQDVAALTAAAIAGQRVSEQGQEGLRAFLDKRKPTWAP